MAVSSKAASELHVTPSAVSLQVRQLEDEIGLKLFERTARGLSLTASGQRVPARHRYRLPAAAGFLRGLE